MRSWVGKAGIPFICAAILAGCGGGGSKPNNTVTQVNVIPSSLSLVSGEVSQLNTSVLNSANNSVIATISYSSSNPNLVTISPSGSVCAGVWDAAFVVCSVVKDKGIPVTGTVNITASAGGVNSAPVPVAVHLPITSIVAGQKLPASSCTSVKQTQQYEAFACSTLATPPDAGPPCGPTGKDITSLVGPFTWTPTNGTVGTVDANGLVTANAPGVMGVIARVGNVSSPAASFRGCMPVAIRLHVSGDTATSATLNVSETRTLQADMDDEAGVTTNSAPVSIVSNNSQGASVSSVTLTAQSAGGAGILAACVPPVCGAGLNLSVYGNLFNVTVNGTSPATTVYATTTFAPPIGDFSTVVPIDTTTNTAGTPINLPGPPNSLVFTPNGAKGYIGTTAGLASLDTATNAVTLVASSPGKVLAVSPDGNTVIFSNAASVPDPITGAVGPIETVPSKQRVFIFTASNNTVQTFVLPAAVAAAFTGDSFKAFIVTNDGSNNIYVYSPFITLQTVNVPGTTSTDVATLASGPFAYLVNGSSLETLSTCNNAKVLSPMPAATSAPQLVKSFANDNLIVAVNSTGLDVNTATVATPLSPPIDSSSCAPGVSYSNQFIDFGLGPITARQLLVPPNTAGHIVVLPSGINKLLTAVAGGTATAITLPASATEALSVGLTLDGNTAWVGVAGTNTVDRIDLNAGTDTKQVATSFKKRDSSAAPPNIVAVKPK